MELKCGCKYISKRMLSSKKKEFLNWIFQVQKDLRKNGYHFYHKPIGSGSRNMVVKLCNKNYYDLDYQIVLTRIPNKLDYNKDAKTIKLDFKNTFDKFKPSGFSNCEDSTQALQTVNKSSGYGFDIIITRHDDNNDFYILYNKKNTNDANNKDYMWAKRMNMEQYKSQFNKIKGPKMWNYLREIYLNKRHNHKDNIEPNKKKAYQLLNESADETLVKFSIK